MARGSIRLPQAANVPNIAPPRDPGVPSRPGAFQDPAATAINAVLPALNEVGAAFSARSKRLAAANARIQKRDDAIKRMNFRATFRGSRQNQQDAIERTGGFKSPEMLTEFGASGQDQINQIIKEAQEGGMGDESLTKLINSLAADERGHTDAGATSAAALADKRVDDAGNAVISSLAARALDGEDPAELIAEGLGHIADGSELGDAMREGSEVIFARKMSKDIVTAVTERAFLANDMNRVDMILDDPFAQENLTTAELVVFAKRSQAIRIAQATPEPNKVVGPGAALVGPSGGVIFQNEKDSRPQISIIDKGRSKFFEDLGAIDAKSIETLETNAQAARRNRTEIVRMQAAIKGGQFTTGSFSDLRVFLARIATFVGLDNKITRSLGSAATADVLDAASANLGVEVAQKLGRITNMSILLIQRSLPSLIRTPEGNEILLEIMDRGEQREIDKARLANDFIRRGIPGEGNPLRPATGKSLFEAIDDLAVTDPVLTPELLERVEKGASKAVPSFADRFGDKKILPKFFSNEAVDELESGAEFIWGPTNQRVRKE